MIFGRYPAYFFTADKPSELIADRYRLVGIAECRGYYIICPFKNISACKRDSLRFPSGHRVGRYEFRRVAENILRLVNIRAFYSGDVGYDGIFSKVLSVEL